MKLYNLTLRSKPNSELEIQYCESPEPKHGIIDKQTLYPENQNEIRVWQKSVKTLDVHPSAVEELRSFKGALEGDGISLSGIEDRLEIKKFEDLNLAKTVELFILKPIPSKEEETQNDMWDYFKNIMYDDTRSVGTKIAYLKTKFNITRK